MGSKTPDTQLHVASQRLMHVQLVLPTTLKHHLAYAHVSSSAPAFRRWTSLFYSMYRLSLALCQDYQQHALPKVNDQHQLWRGSQF